MADNSFQQALDYIRAIADTERRKGTLFEQLMKAYFQKDRHYSKRFVNVQTWKEWAVDKEDFDGTDIGIDLVAEERSGGYCAIQCKCYAANQQISKAHVDSFLAASSKEIFVSRILVATGGGLSANAERALLKTYPPCQEIYTYHIEESALDFPKLVQGEAPEDLEPHPPFTLLPHQIEALNDVLKGFETHDRGKMIMACGTGKTFAALRIAEQVAGEGGRVLYLVPSIALFGQAMREWAEQSKLDHSYIGVCSDKKAGYADEDAQIYELELPVTTDAEKISEALLKTDNGKMTVVFSTYHSLPIIEAAQANGAPEFDLILCDEAHRTTGVKRADEEISHFNLVHDNERIRAKKRLYMTATPRLYTDTAKTRAAKHDIGIYSMDDEDFYGPEFHRLSFSKAVERNLLSDYKVVLFAVTEAPAEADGGTYLTREDGSEINITDATKIVGCWKALHNPAHAEPGKEKRLQRAIVFANTIKNSKAFRDHFQPVVERAIEMEQERENEQADHEETPNANAMDALPQEFHCETAHVDGTDHALIRKRQIDWLKREKAGDENGGCRILSNARCLSEGVDVPALDAVIFIEPKRSIIDIVQAVGRVMRKFKGKEEGYIILPVACPADADGADILDKNERFGVVWDVVKALRAHDERLDAEINQIDLNNEPPERFIIHEEKESYNPQTRLFPTFDIPPGAIYAKMVERCGDRKYWEKWAADVAEIFQRTTERIEGMLSQSGADELKEWFSEFHDELRSSINDSITEENARDMLAQHIVMKPVFEAIFEEYDFANRNPVAKALESLRKDFSEYGLEDETKSLARFYESVQNRIKGLDNSEGRQTVLKELYEKFFQIAFKKDADRLGIVYTPVEIIDFILRSADDILRSEFERAISDEGVHILDPFAGAGLFLARLLQSKLIRDEDIERKFQQELYANEILLLAYYIAAVNIEEAYRGRLEEGAKYAPFKGIALTDTFNIKPNENEDAPQTDEANLQLGASDFWMAENKERIDNLKDKEIDVIVGNPPWSAGQRTRRTATQTYPILKWKCAYEKPMPTVQHQQIRTVFTITTKWLSAGRQTAFKNAESRHSSQTDHGSKGMSTQAYGHASPMNSAPSMSMNLQGRTSALQGEMYASRRRQQCSETGSRTRSVAITLLVKNPDAKHDGCRIFYRRC